MKKLQLLLCGVLAVLSLTSCGLKKSNTDILEDYLETRYNEDFKFVSKIGDTPGSSNKNQISATFTCDSFGEQKVNASYSKDNSGEHYADNYMAIKYNQEATNKISQAVNDAGYYDYIVNLEVMDGVMTIDDIKTYTVDTYMKDYNAFKSVDIILNKSTLEESDFNAIMRSFEINNITTKGIIAVPKYDIDAVFDELNRINLSEIGHMVTFSIENGEILYETWSD